MKLTSKMAREIDLKSEDRPEILRALVEFWQEEAYQANVKLDVYKKIDLDNALK